MDQPWKDSKTVQFAVGATLILIFAWWMFTGDIPFLSKVAFSEPPNDSEGNVQAVEWLPVIWGMLFQACVIVGASAIALFSGIWTSISNSFNHPVTTGPASASAPSADSVAAVSDSPDSMVRGLAKAVATNDSASTTKYSTQIRRPYATAELVAALEDGKFDLADERMLELKELAGVAPQPKAVKGGAK